MLPGIGVRGLVYLKCSNSIYLLRNYERFFSRNYLIRRKASKDINQRIYSLLSYLNYRKIVRGKIDYEKRTLTFQFQNLTQAMKRFQGVGNNFKNQKLENCFQSCSAKRLEVLDV